jgi:glycosyltransferase involved in cell wall biosynthesis
MPGDATQRLFWPRKRAIAKTFDEVQPHVVVVATPGPFGWTGIREARKRGLPVCVAHHTNFEGLADLYWNRVVGGVIEWFLKVLHYRVFRAANLVVANSEHMTHAVEKAGIADVRVVGTTVAARLMDAPLVEYDGGLNRVLFLGRLAPEKRIERLLDAAEAQPHRTFVIAGDGPLRKTIEKRAKELPNLEYIGWVPRDNVVDVIDQSDLLVLPSAIESFGTVAIEAMVRGRLVLVSRECGIMEWPMLASGCVNLETGETVADALDRIDAMGARARQDAAQRGRIAVTKLVDSTVGQWTNLFHELVEGAR